MWRLEEERDGRFMWWPILGCQPVSCLSIDCYWTYTTTRTHTRVDGRLILNCFKKKKKKSFLYAWATHFRDGTRFRNPPLFYPISLCVEQNTHTGEISRLLSQMCCPPPTPPGWNIFMFIYVTVEIFSQSVTNKTVSFFLSIVCAWVPSLSYIHPGYYRVLKKKKNAEQRENEFCFIFLKWNETCVSISFDWEHA